MIITHILQNFNIKRKIYDWELIKAPAAVAAGAYSRIFQGRYQVKRKVARKIAPITHVGMEISFTLPVNTLTMM